MELIKFQMKCQFRLSMSVLCMNTLDMRSNSKIYILVVIWVRHLVQLLVKYLLRNKTIK